MNPVERRAVVIDLCRDCKGVFLDRGELDKLLDAAEAQQAAPAESWLARRPDRDRDDDEDDRRGSYDRGPRRKKRGGFLGELFESD